MEICTFLLLKKELNYTIFFLQCNIIVLLLSDLPLASQWLQREEKVKIFTEYGGVLVSTLRWSGRNSHQRSGGRTCSQYILQAFSS